MQLNKEKWDAVDYFDFVQNLKSISQIKHAEFSSKIIPGAQNILGVRIPVLRAMAKEIIRGDWAGFLRRAQDDTFEEIMIQGIVIGTANMNIGVVIKMTDEFLPKINNWAVCDCFCASLKTVGIYKNEFLPLIKIYLASHEEYTVRFAIVMLLNYYIEEKYIHFILETLNSLKYESYYIRMSVAWTISECYIKFTEETKALLMNNDLDDFTFNKAVDKIIDSRRVPMAEKNMLKKLKKTKRA